MSLSFNPTMCRPILRRSAYKRLSLPNEKRRSTLKQRYARHKRSRTYKRTRRIAFKVKRGLLRALYQLPCTFGMSIPTQSPFPIVGVEVLLFNIKIQ
ncbi:hypothetical protein BU24DRAFT_464063 [Aaosphaeria arxii CBS 175.79]|uniref:Uncharacterized protein n=1 Tax=Aaosphaeria arxii CBS 175.79 TaxID=1450172 RepID=A0A6A5XK80_9PLEO|nr:uncharacterized protein BU24DRAFT_464063 [Aaosphaeria arxii CBS 175.79]KAF2013251.1 hypothetical protein BU24DRAFT_464063 [Aaosphaeria arxii CBS 175.79]